MKIASIQLEFSDGKTKEEMTAYACSMIERCGGADLILLPELWPTGFLNFDRYHDESEPLDGPTAQRMADLAKKHAAYIHAGSIVEKADDGKYYNTSMLFDRQGNLAGTYRKIHLYPFGCREPELLAHGAELCVVDTEFGRIGLSICFDIRFPELYRRLAEMGAAMFINVACWSFPKIRDWELFNQARALENTAFMISCGGVGGQEGAKFVGSSRVVDPWGTVVAGGDYREGIMTAAIDPGMVERVRGEYPILNHRRLR